MNDIFDDLIGFILMILMIPMCIIFFGIVFVISLMIEFGNLIAGKNE